MPSHAQITARSSTLSTRSIQIEYTATKIPEPSANFETTFKNSSGAQKDAANEFLIDVLPNFNPIFCYILYHVNLYSPHLEMTNHAKISSATFAAYCFGIIYAYILSCDLSIRPRPSPHASSFDEITHKRNFFLSMQNMPVPEFLAPILYQLTPTTDEMRNNIYIGPSAAGFSYEHYFGKFFPISMFTAIHDCVAETDSRNSRLSIMSDLFRRPIYSILDYPFEDNTFTASVANFIGSGLDINDQPSFLGSTINQSFETLFNPCLFRDYQRRKNLASISLEPITYDDQHMNFYDLVFSASPMNLHELTTVFSSIASAMKGSITCPGDLASFFTNLSGTHILTHGYSLYALPTYHHAPIKYGSDADTLLSTLKSVSPKVFAKALNFLQQPSPSITQSVPQPTGICQVEKEHDVLATHETPFCRTTSKEATRQNPSNTTNFEIFSEERHTFPKVYILSPFSPDTIEIWKASAFGMIIESIDIDGTVIAFPNTDLALGSENTLFADSAIPIRYCYRSSHFGSVAQTPSAIARSRVRPLRQTRMTASSILVDRTTINLPQFAATIVQSTESQAFAGLTHVGLATWPVMLQSFFGFRTADARDHKSSSDSITGMSNDRLLVWSPYTYTSYEGFDDFDHDHSRAKTYFLTNLRTIFGTRVPLIQVNHPLQCMPIY
jgi:hypothetical protein